MVEVIVDVENLDAVLGFQILKHKPLCCERPDIRLLLPRLEELVGLPASATAILREGDEISVKKRKFAQVLSDAGIRVVWAETTARRRHLTISRDVVDDVVDFFLRNSRAGTVMAASHDHFVAYGLNDQKEKGARVGILGFSEFISNRSASIADFILDLEYDVGMFTRPLPRLQPF